MWNPGTSIGFSGSDISPLEQNIQGHDEDASSTRGELMSNNAIATKKILQNGSVFMVQLAICRQLFLAWMDTAALLPDRSFVKVRFQKNEESFQEPSLFQKLSEATAGHPQDVF